ncbi:MAG: FAD-binding protein [Firmicutes bacterium]|nr:FAD-binding protein [Bacillota bacterium]
MSREDIYDIIVIGMGPASSIFLKELDGSKYKTICIDKKSLSGEGFIKPCGGLLAPDAQKKLAELNLSLPLNVLVDPQIFSVKARDMGMDIERFYQRFYMNMDRSQFDLWLMSKANPEIRQIEKAVVTNIDKIDDYYNVSYIIDNKEFNIKGKYLIGGDGSKSLVRKKFFKNVTIRQYVCIQEWYQSDKKSPSYMTIFDKDITDSYGWLNYKGVHEILGAAFPKTDSKVRFEKLKTKMIKDGHIFGELTDREVCQVSCPSSVKELCYGGNGIFLIGEAAGFVSPSSLEGLSYAMDSGHLLAKVFNNDNLSVKYYSKLLKPLRRKLFIKILKNKMLYTPIIRKWIMLSNISTIKIKK